MKWEFWRKSVLGTLLLLFLVSTFLLLAAAFRDQNTVATAVDTESSTLELGEINIATKAKAESSTFDINEIVVGLRIAPPADPIWHPAANTDRDPVELIFGDTGAAPVF